MTNLRKPKSAIDLIQPVLVHMPSAMCICVYPSSLSQGGVVLVSHDEHLIEIACQEVWLCQDQTVRRLEGGLQQYKTAIETEFTGSGFR